MDLEKNSATEPLKPKLVPEASLTSEEDTCTKCLKWSFLSLNILAFLIGGAVVGVCVWLLKSEFNDNFALQFLEDKSHLLPLHIAAVAGMVILVVSIGGVVGALIKNKWVLIVYSPLLAIAVVALAMTCGLFFPKSRSSEPEIILLLKDTLTNNYGVNVKTNPENRRLTEIWDNMQQKFGCCGVSGDMTFVDSWAYYSTNTLWFNEQQKGGQKVQKVPLSCCKPAGNNEICTGETYFSGPPNHQNSPKPNPYLYTMGCSDKLLENFRSVRPIELGLCVGMGVSAVVMMIGVLLSLYFVAHISKYSRGGVDLPLETVT